MTISYTRLFTTQGLYAGALNETNTWRGTLGTRATTLNTQLITSTVYNALYSGTFTNRDAAKKAEDSYIGNLSAAATAALLAEVEADRPGAGTALDSAITELRRQMLISAQTLNDCPGTVTVASVGSPSGDPQFVFGLYEPKTGLKADFFVPDVLLVQCDQDRSQNGTAYAEHFTIKGKTADSLPTDASYPSGSGLDTSVTLIDPATDESIVSNGAFNAFTVANTPDDWTLSSGTVAGTHVFKKTSDDPRGTDPAANISLRLVGDGVQIIKLRQTVTLLPNTAYTVQFRAKKVADPGTDWGVTLRLVDAVAFTAVAGNGSYTNSVSTVTCGSMSSDWQNVVTGVFLTPAVLPVNGIAVEIAFTQFNTLGTAAANTAEVYVDHVSMIETEALYPGGPTLTAFSGISQSVVGDTRTATVAITGVPSTYLIRQMDRLLGLASLTDRIPTVAGGGETISDSLVA